MIEIITAKTEAQFVLIEQLGNVVWREHYTSIIGIDQVEYMLNKFQTAKIIETQVSEGYQYYIISLKANPAGYFAIRKDENALFLSKLYVLQEFRGQGLGKTAMQFIENEAKQNNCNKISLTVNKYNTNSIKVYENIGFVNTGDLVIDIGNGFIMDDFTMEKSISGLS